MMISIMSYYVVPSSGIYSFSLVCCWLQWLGPENIHGYMDGARLTFPQYKIEEFIYWLVNCNYNIGYSPSSKAQIIIERVRGACSPVPLNSGSIGW